MKRKLIAALGVLALIATPVLAAGLWPDLPIVGGAAYCGSTSVAGVPGTSGVCNNTVPAGPSALTGTEFVPADTAYAQGQPPQTVKVPASLFATGAIQVVTSNTSVTIANGISTLVSNQSTATIASITLPSAPMNNQVVTIANAGSGVLTITAINAASGQSIVQGAAPASLGVQTNNAAAAVLSSVAYEYQASNTTWYRIR
ncbi:MAG TPA: hypothetical protein VFX37_10585 [Pseudolabrys sp.]|nr:hypothetical protein [Pseudolabrys sp.]